MKRQDRELCVLWASENNHMTAISAYMLQDKQGCSSLHTQEEDMKKMTAKLRFHALPELQTLKLVLCRCVDIKTCMRPATHLHVSEDTVASTDRQREGQAEQTWRPRHACTSQHASMLSLAYLPDRKGVLHLHLPVTPQFVCLNF